MHERNWFGASSTETRDTAVGYKYCGPNIRATRNGKINKEGFSMVSRPPVQEKITAGHNAEVRDVSKFNSRSLQTSKKTTFASTKRFGIYC